MAVPFVYPRPRETDIVIKPFVDVDVTSPDYVDRNELVFNPTLDVRVSSRLHPLPDDVCMYVEASPGDADATSQGLLDERALVDGFHVIPFPDYVYSGAADWYFSNIFARWDNMAYADGDVHCRDTKLTDIEERSGLLRLQEMIIRHPRVVGNILVETYTTFGRSWADRKSYRRYIITHNDSGKRGYEVYFYTDISATVFTADTVIGGVIIERYYSIGQVSVYYCVATFDSISVKSDGSLSLVGVELPDHDKLNNFGIYMLQRPTPLYIKKEYV